MFQSAKRLSSGEDRVVVPGKEKNREDEVPSLRTELSVVAFSKSNAAIV